LAGSSTRTPTTRISLIGFASLRKLREDMHPRLRGSRIADLDATRHPVPTLV
jgi:hypothetical protein